MKIDNSVKGTNTVVGKAVPRAESSPAPASSAENAATQVQISSLSALGVDGVLANTPVTNASKIAEIKQAISDGRFTVNPEKIADGLLDNVRQLLGRQSSSN